MPELHIQSTQNERLKAAVKLRDRRHRERAKRILIDGWREIERASAAGISPLEIYLPADEELTSEQRRWVTQWSSAGATVLWATAAVYQRVAFGQRETGPVAVAATPNHSLASLTLPPEPLIAVVEGVEKPGNLGAILRSADGAGVDAVVVADPSTDLYNPNAIRASLGTIFSLLICQATAAETVQWLHQHVQHVFVAQLERAQPYEQADFRKSCAIVLGSEAHGVTAIWQAQDFVPIRLPMLGIADSLNVSATAAVLFYEARRQRSNPATGSSPAV